ncbi:helix-hairpin-helix domain-containing protein, partial [bacterium]|nr:helix-hairpin-helix domain-containing protein [bacterium]
MKTTKRSLIDINTADEKQLVSELKISPRLVKRIIAFRPYKSTDQLNQVWGIDPATLERLQTLIYVESEVLPEQDETSTAPEATEIEVTSTDQETITDFEEPFQPIEPKPKKVKEKDKTNSILNLLLFFIILIGAFFRFNGNNWDVNKH